jgi:methyl acetate hydrolase
MTLCIPLPFFAASTNGVTTSQGEANEHSLVWLASLSKAITAFGALLLIDKGLLRFEDSLAKHLPEYAHKNVLEKNGTLRPALGEITVKSLFTHTSGLSYEMWNPHLSAYMQAHNIPRTASCLLKSLDVPLMQDPHTKFDYSISIDYLGLVIERVSGQKLSDYLQKAIFTPLGMKNTSFIPSDVQKQTRLSMNTRQEDGSLKAIPFETAQVQEFNMGGGGLWGTAYDYLLFLKMLLDPKAMLSPKLKAAIFQNQIGALNYQFQSSVSQKTARDFEFMPGIEKKWGWLGLVNTQDITGGRKAYSSAWAGLANCYWWADPQSQIAGVFLSQCLPFGDEEALKAFIAFERKAYAI